MNTALGRLLRPQGVAVVGASRDPSKHGSRVVANLRRVGFSGPLWAVNRDARHIEGVDGVVPEVEELPAGIDTMVCAIPGSAIAETVRGAGRVGICSVVVFSGGFAELGADGVAAQRQVVAAAAAAGVRLLGPNSGGVVCPSYRSALSFLTWLDRPAEQIRSGPVGLVTQSGGMGSYVHSLAAGRGGGLAASISTGNEADLGIADAIVELAKWDAVRAVAVILETVRRGPEFGAALSSARDLGKPVVVCRLGRSHLSDSLLKGHTGALAVGERVLAGVLDAHRAIVAETPEEMLDIAEVLAQSPKVRGRRVGVVTHSGGTAILLADLADAQEFELPTPSPALATAVEANLQSGSAGNPVDLGSIIGGPTRFTEVVRTVRDSGEYDAVVAVSTPHPPGHTDERVGSLVALHGDKSPVPVINLWMTADLGTKGLARLRAAGVPVVQDPRSAVRAVGGMCKWVSAGPLGNGESTIPPASEVFRGRLAGIELPEVVGILSEGTARGLLAAWGVASCDGDTARSPDEAALVAEGLGFPVVAKIDGPGLPHKSALGAVQVDLRSAEEVRRAFGAIVAAAKARAPEVHPDGVLVARFEPGLELLAGCVVDPIFGAVTLLGLGGTAAEFLGSAVSVPMSGVAHPGRYLLERLGRLVPNGLESLAMTAPSAPDWEGLVEVIDRLAQAFVAGQPRLAELEVNPLIWTGASWKAADAMVRLEEVV